MATVGKFFTPENGPNKPNRNRRQPTAKAHALMVRRGRRFESVRGLCKAAVYGFPFPDAVGLAAPGFSATRPRLLWQRGGFYKARESDMQGMPVERGLAER